MGRMVVPVLVGLFRYLERYKRAVMSLVVILLIFGCEKAVSRFAFDCPCTLIGDNRTTVPVMRLVYSALYMGAPALIFLIVGIMLQENTWRCLSGCCRQGLLHAIRNCACVWVTLGMSIMAPTAWLVFVLLDGRYLDCAMSEVPTECLSWVQYPSDRETQKEASHDIRVRSQVIGLSLAAALLLLYFFAVVIYHCCSSMSHYQMQFASHVRQVEQYAFEAAVKEELEAEFKKKWRALMRDGTTEDWMSVSEMTSPSPVEVDGQNYYSPFHLWQSEISVSEEACNTLNFTYTKNGPPKISLPTTDVSKSADPHKRHLPPLYSAQAPTTHPEVRENGGNTALSTFSVPSANDTQALAATDGSRKKRARKTKRSQVQDVDV